LQKIFHENFQIYFSCNCNGILRDYCQCTKKKPAAASKSGPIEMPAGTETQSIPNEEKFTDMIMKINEAVVFKYDNSYKNADVYIMKNGKETLMYKVKSNDTGWIKN
jgi:hypothetical protein